ncbi:hypothetical protein OPT61_g6486 [Boeremia exigua]|uniref:Uncharacterized protein n=1 Tax=Boeremia exigua TaxID=749465 RepID=A0ACC2I6H4_9PLEO|nr:hypothetical protein OPT61_g6486 [Boeremia exigua]
MTDTSSAANVGPDLPARHTGPFRILDLPPELITGICSHLCAKDLLNIRRVCNSLNGNSMPILGPLVFRHLRVILHPASLAVLSEIAKHPQLSKYITQISLCGERLGYEVPVANQQSHMDLHNSIVKSGFATLVLRQVLQSLPSLNEIVIRPLGWSYNAYHGEAPKAIACGRSNLVKEDEWEDFEYTGYNNPVFQVALPLLTDLDLRHCFAVKIMLSDEYGGNTMEMLASDLAAWNRVTRKRTVSITISESHNVERFEEMLHSANNLRDLELWGIKQRTYVSLNRFYDSLDSLDLTHIPSWPCLKSLYFTCFMLDAKDLNALLRAHHDNLETVQLRGVGLHHHTWQETIHLLSTLEKLRYIQLETLLEEYTHECYHCFYDKNITREALKVGTLNSKCRNENEINIRIKSALNALLSEYRTIPIKHPINISGLGDEDEVIYSHRVDLRKAIAAAAEQLASQNESRDPTKSSEDEDFLDEPIDD